MVAGHVVDRVIEVEVVVVRPDHGIVHIVRVDGQAQATTKRMFPALVECKVHLDEARTNKD